ncbi:GumC family protein [Solidesulfovibrio alcoholivorans]|uniref:GumC family protein n=1 Tax=Solidesulfovibrio alcoholivorans TaxID=81406 RepID=UPI000496B949|nr:polysaccharide biosynthesis protein [Solidesulfovibrio alcoholivorans]
MELRQLLALLWRRRALMAWTFAAIFGGLLAIALLCETQYVASAKVYLYHSATKATLLNRVSLDSPMVSSASLTDTERATYEDLAVTVPVLRPVIAELDLKRKRKSLQVLEYVPFVRLLIDHFWPRLGLRPMTYEELTNKSLVHVLFPRPYLKAAMMEDSDILEFSSSASSLRLSMDLANAAARSFVARESAMRQDECRAVAESAARELPKAKASYEQALAAQQEVRRTEKIVDLTTEGQQLVSRYYTLSADRDANRLSLIRAQGMLANVKAQLARRPEFRKTSEATQRSSLIDSVKLTLRDLYLDLAAAKVRLTAEHPAVKEIENKIAEAKKIIKGEAQKVFGSETVSTDPTWSYLSERAAEYASQVAGYECQDEAFATLLAGVEKKADAFPGRAAASALVAARVDANQAFLSNLNQMEAMAKAGEGMDLSIAHVVEPAERPGKIDDYMRPKLSLMLAAGIAVGAFLAVVAALAAAWTDATVGTREALAEAGTRVLGAVPRRDLPARGQALRRLREAIFPAGDATAPVVVIAGADDADGDAPRLAFDLARAVARGGTRTLVVDADLCAPRCPDTGCAGDTAHRHGLVAGLAGLPPGPGLAEALSGEVALDAVLVPGSEPELFVLPAGRELAFEAADRLMDGPRLGETLAVLGGRFDRVLVAAAPFSRSGDALACGRAGAAVLLVAGLFRTPARAVAEAAEACRAALGRAPASVLSGVPADDLSPREQWRALTARFRRKRPVRVA